MDTDWVRSCGRAFGPSCTLAIVVMHYKAKEGIIHCSSEISRGVDGSSVQFYERIRSSEVNRAAGCGALDSLSLCTCLQELAFRH